MKITGIICEYNPFHYGHKLHIDKTKELLHPDVLVCVMSSNFTQRGEAAICDKWQRSKEAVLNGVDIVFELPFIYSTQSANNFASGAIDILKLAKVDNICFGSESNNLDILKQLSNLDDDISEKKLEGISSNKAYETLYGKLNPNDILGLNYLKNINDSNIEAYTIQRTTNYHDKEMKGIVSSATSIRNALSNNQDYQKSTPMKLDTTFMMNNYFNYIKTLLLSKNSDELNEIFMMDEGIENNFIKNIKKSNSYDEFVDKCVSKRYSRSRIQRTIIHLMNNTKKSEVNNLEPINYLRVLAYNETGKKYLKELKKTEVNIASKFNQIPEMYRNMELKATSVYAYPIQENKQEFINKELQPPQYIKKVG